MSNMAFKGEMIFYLDCNQERVIEELYIHGNVLEQHSQSVVTNVFLAFESPRILKVGFFQVSSTYMIFLFCDTRRFNLSWRCEDSWVTRYNHTCARLG